MGVAVAGRCRGIKQSGSLDRLGSFLNGNGDADNDSDLSLGGARGGGGGGGGGGGESLQMHKQILKHSSCHLAILSLVVQYALY